MAFLRSLTKLYVYKNFIEELPEGLSKCTQLRVLDVSANRLRVFPAELSNLPLKELYCEENNLLQHIPVHSQQEDEVLTLKEISARLVLKELKNGRSYVKRFIRHYPKVQEMLQFATDCAVCGQSFLNTWLECVHFVDARKVLRTKTRPGIIPVRGLLCSYKCFNTEGHDYFGIAYVGDTWRSYVNSVKSLSASVNCNCQIILKLGRIHRPAACGKILMEEIFSWRLTLLWWYTFSTARHVSIDFFPSMVIC